MRTRSNILGSQLFIYMCLDSHSDWWCTMRCDGIEVAKQFAHPDASCGGSPFWSLGVRGLPFSS